VTATSIGTISESVWRVSSSINTIADSGPCIAAARTAAPPTSA
jgi:hypothetical protein